MRRLLAIIAIAFALLAPVAVPVFAAGAPDPQGTIYTQVPIPDTPLETTAGGYLRGKVANLGSYIAAIYNFLLSIVGVVAAVSMIYGGFLWMTSGGASDRAKAGKKRISDAVIGLILAFAAFVILNTINPDLVAFKPLSIPIVQTVKYSSPVIAPEGLCNTDADCKPPKYEDGYKCFHVLTGGPGKQDGLCAKAQTNAPDNAVCSADDECLGKRCLKNSPTSASGICGSGRDKSYCRDSQDCLKGTCVATGIIKTCSVGAEASFCNDDKECNKGLTCVKLGNVGRCSSGQATFGGLCKSSQDCKSIGGVCGSSQAHNPSCATDGENGTYYFCFCRTPDLQPEGNYCYSGTECKSSKCQIDLQFSGGRPGAIGHCT